MMKSAVFACFSAAAVALSPADDPTHGGSRYVTTHSVKNVIERSECGDWNEETQGIGEIKEFHFHTYFHLNGPTVGDPCGDECAVAKRIRTSIIDHVSAGRMVAVCDGITDAILPGINMTDIPPVNMAPRGPHPVGSFETWVPKEYLNEAMSFFMQQRGELSILFHPLTNHSVEDHTGRAMWMGQPYRIHLDPLTVSGEESDPPQYPELGLGYSKK